MKKGFWFRKWFVVILAFGLLLGAFPGGGSAAASTILPLQSFDDLIIESESAETFISPRINTSSQSKVRVIVQLDGQPAAVGKYATRVGIRSLAAAATESAVRVEQQDFLEEAKEQGLDLQVNYQYNTVLNGFEITIPANEIPSLAQIPGVKSIQENSIWYPIPIASASTDEAVNYDETPLKQIGADIAWSQGLTGKGLKVGVVDTGVDYEHPDLKDAYKGGYDSFYKDEDPYEEIPLTPAADPHGKGYGGTSHGTHVAGILVGRGANTSGSIAQKGVAYEAELYAYKVLGRDLKEPTTASGTSAQLIDGIERAVKDGMDVINLSLGSDTEKNVNSPDAIAINNAVLSGVIVVSANGNAGPGNYTMGSPATSQLGIAVGAVTSESRLYHSELSYQFVDKSKSVTDAAYTAVPTSATLSTYETTDLIAFGWQSGREDLKAILGTDPIDVVYVGLGDAKDYANKDVAGKVVLASRGKSSFTEKVAYAGLFGAKAIVIFNGIEDGNHANLNEFIPDRDGYIDTTLGDNPLFIPAFDMKGKEGRALAKAILNHPDLSLQFAFGANYELQTMRGDILASFSSWGPNADANLSIKPDVMAPGVSILSTYPAYGKNDSNASYEKAYMRSNGTSMSTPYVSGLALLLKQQHPDWTPFDIRAALANTADVIRDENNNRYDVYKQGAGRVNVSQAIKTPALLQALEPITILDSNYSPKNVINYNSSASFGVIAKGGVAVKNLQLKNISDQPVTYDASVEWHQANSEVEISLDKSTITAAAKSASILKLDLRVANHAEEGFYQGQVNLTSPGQPSLHLPFTLYVGNQQPDNGFGIQEVKLTHSTIYPNRSSQKSTDLTFRLTAADTNYYMVVVVNLKDELLGYFAAEATDDLNERFAPGVYTVPGINGTYYPVDANGKLTGTTAQLNTGRYKILVSAAQITPDGEIVEKGDKKIEYKALSSLQVDLSGNSEGGGSGGGIGGGGGGGSSAAPGGAGGAVPSPAPATPAKPTPNQSADLEPSAVAVVEQGQKQIVITPNTGNTKEPLATTILDDDLMSALTSINNEAAALIIAVPDNDQHHVRVRFSPSQLKQLAEKLNTKSTIIVSFEGSAVALPASLLRSAPSGAELEIHISKAESDKFKFNANASGAKVIGSPISFEANWIVGTTKKPMETPSNVFIKRAFTIPGSIAANQAGVLYESSGIIRPVASVMNAQADGSTLVTVSRPGFSVYAAVERSVHFKDIASSWAAADITALANKFIIQGTSAEAFSPNNNLTRAEFTSLLVRSLGLQAAGAVTFSDVSSTAWYADDVAAAYEAGLIQGTGQDKFSPNAYVTRQELSTILARALKLTGTELKISNPSIKAYKDEASIAGYALENVKTLSAAGIISGDHSDNGQSFQPNAPTTRETVASALRQFLRQAELIE
ncbi:S8 family serine peptidase [Paenibacillus bouchesdurhonensis]|uniref:S8 family serine peptidase n=1 Tax=Paenibacillus bouchesdurhonensis TaxID=1870990 RepID=UPI000DA63A6E|nr:S8 family serine peptidase [Paenibacillus bouchesdurhonensis]